MKTVHFVYVLPPSQSILCRVYRRLTRREISRATSVSSYNWQSPLRAPHSITFNVGKHLECRYKVKFYDWSEVTKIHPNTGDILLGHLSPDFETIMWNSIRDTRFSKRYLIQPYNNEETQVGFLRDGLVLCDGCFAIGGDFWVDNFTASPFREFTEKFFHLNMAVDSLSYPIVKRIFNPPGKRRFFYIGSKGPRGDAKGIGLLEEMAKRIPDFQGGYICAGAEIKGWTKISSPTPLTPELMSKIGLEYDIFLNMSRADAQATTILEAMSWGFPVACTNQSGYSRENSLFYMSTEDMQFNIEMIERIQNLNDCELKDIAAKNRLIAETKYSWQTFLGSIDNILKGEL